MAMNLVHGDESRAAAFGAQLTVEVREPVRLTLQVAVSETAGATAQVAGTTDSAAVLAAVSSWVGDLLSYVPGSSAPTVGGGGHDAQAPGRVPRLRPSGHRLAAGPGRAGPPDPVYAPVWPRGTSTQSPEAAPRRRRPERCGAAGVARSDPLLRHGTLLDMHLTAASDGSLPTGDVTQLVSTS